MSYPGWLILPVEELGRLRILPQETEGEIEESSDHLRFVLESIWRRKNGRIPANIQDLETADEHYENDSILFNQDDRIELCVNVASQWRLYKDWGKWSMWMNRLKAISTMEAQLWFSYENALRALLEWKDDLVLTNASRLKDGGPIWKMRRAGLLSALFRHQEAAELYENALKEIRMKLRADPVSPWLISLEGWADVSYRATHSSLANTHHGPYMPQDDEDRLRYMAAKADPWQIIFHLDKVATKKMIENREGPWKDRPSFYPGQICHELRFNSAEICPFYYVLEIMERTGAPARGVDFDLFSTRLLDGYLAMEDPDEHDLLTFLARYQGDSVRALDSILPRTRVARLSGEAVLMLIKSVMKRSEVLLSANERRRSDNHLNFLIALLGRVVVRADQQESIETVFQWGKNLLTSGVLHFDCLRKCGDMLKGCIGAMDTALRQKALEFALHHLLSGETDRKIHPMFWPEFIDLFTEEDVREIEVTSKLSDRIDSLIALVTNSEPRDRFRALNRLRVLHKADKLTECQNSDLEAAIWDGVGETEWPKHKYFLPWVFLDLPGHQRAEPVFKKRVLDPLAKGDFDAERLVNLQGGIGLLGREIGIEHIRDCIQKCIDWEPAPKTKQSDRLAQVQENPVEKEIGYALAQALLPLLKPDDVKGRIKETLHRIPELTYIPTISSTAFQFVRLCPELRKEGFSMLNQALASRDDARVFSSLFSVRSFLEHRPEEVSMLAELAEKMVVRLEQRIQPGLSSSIELVVEMTKLNCLSNDHKSRLANALTQIIEEYRYDQDRLPVRSMVDLPLVRRQIHRLVVRLAPEFSELVELVNLLKEDPLPEVRLCERPWQVPTID